MHRIRLKALENWKNKKNRKPLILRGARQVGKTWLVRELAKNFESFVEVNLEAQADLIPLFESYYGKPEELIRYLAAATGFQITPGKTLLFIDEVQESSKAILALRYFKEKIPLLHVIAAGSLIEFALKELSFPVGRIEFLYLFPLSFQEFLFARGQGELAQQIGLSNPTKPLPDPLHDQAMKEIHHYSLIGGMPEVVKTYCESKDLKQCQAVQQGLIANFRSDFNKYASRARVSHLKILFDSIPRFLGKKFQYSQVSSHIRSRELKEGLILLEEAGLIYQATHSSGNGVPLSSESKPEKFKTFFLDIGLCQRILGVDLNAQLIDSTSPAYRGSLAEQLVAQELISLTGENDSPRIFYWHRESKSAQAEVDFLLEQQSKVIPIEVKSGSKGSLKSLHVFMQEKKSKEGIKISENEFSLREIPGMKASIEEVPFYAIGTRFGIA